MKKSKKTAADFGGSLRPALSPCVAGIPVVDGVNLSQTTVSAIQNVAAVTKQI